MAEPVQVLQSADGQAGGERLDARPAEGCGSADGERVTRREELVSAGGSGPGGQVPDPRRPQLRIERCASDASLGGDNPLSQAHSQKERLLEQPAPGTAAEPPRVTHETLRSKARGRRLQAPPRRRG